MLRNFPNQAIREINREIELAVSPQQTPFTLENYCMPSRKNCLVNAQFTGQ